MHGDDSEKPALRDKLRDALAGFVKQARFREDIATSEKKFTAAFFDVARSDYELAVGNAADRKKLGRAARKGDLGSA